MGGGCGGGWRARDGDAAGAAAVAPLPIADGVAAGAYRACAFDQGDVRCWGLWNKIWTGSGPAPSGTAIASLGLQRTVEVTVGGEQICVRSAVGVVECWGLVAGDGSSVEKKAPVVVARLGRVRSLSAAQR